PQALPLHRFIENRARSIRLTGRRIVMRMRTFGISLATAAGLLVLPHHAAAQDGQLVPLLKCVIYNQNVNTLLAFFGYASTFQQTQAIDVGPGNFFSPGVLFRNQPTTFLPGVHEDVFATSFQVSASLPQVSWSLNGSFVVAKNDPALYCNSGT